jgi:hypothetical protein
VLIMHVWAMYLPCADEAEVFFCYIADDRGNTLADHERVWKPSASIPSIIGGPYACMDPFRNLLLAS